MDYANMLGLSPAFGLGGQVNEDVAMQNAVAAPDAPKQPPAKPRPSRMNS